MLLIPAIDLKDGCVVRLVQGKFSDKKIYSKDAVKTAKHWARQGAVMLHVVDLDGASTGVLKNIEIVKDILKEVAVPLEFGGGARDLKTIQMLLSLGISRVVLGTKAVEDRNFLKEAFKKCKEKLIVSVDAKEGKVLTKGWQESPKNIDALEFAAQLKDIGFSRIIYTDTSKDGTLAGPNIKDLKTLLKATGLKVIASGGISSLEDIRKLKSLEKQGVEGVIVGKALYEGRFTLTEAIKISA